MNATNHSSVRFATVLFLLTFLHCPPRSMAADADRCAICDKLLVKTIYTVHDKVTHSKLFICYDCAICSDECYICGLPVRANPTRLADGRILCARDAKTAVLDESKAKEICETIKDTLDRKFSRFMALPSTNVTVALVDRVDLFDEYAVVGSDFECPDILGYIHSRTNRHGLDHSISLMSALPLAEFEATCAHEYAHAWVFENVPLERRKRLSRDAHEGFCELIAYSLMDSLHEEEQMKRMLQNTYTRGQIDLFLAADNGFGFNDVLDWMRWGVSSRLNAAALGDIRDVQMPRPTSNSATNNFTLAQSYVQARAPAPANLVLKGISLSGNQPFALINDQTFAAGETAKVRVGTTNILVRCLSIGPRSVRIRLLGSGKETDLFLAGVSR